MDEDSKTNMNAFPSTVSLGAMPRDVTGSRIHRTHTKKE